MIIHVTLRDRKNGLKQNQMQVPIQYMELSHTDKLGLLLVSQASGSHYSAGAGVPKTVA